MFDFCGRGRCVNSCSASKMLRVPVGVCRNWTEQSRIVQELDRADARCERRALNTATRLKMIRARAMSRSFFDNPNVSVSGARSMRTQQVRNPQAVDGSIARRSFEQYSASNKGYGSVGFLIHEIQHMITCLSHPTLLPHSLQSLTGRAHQILIIADGSCTEWLPAEK